MENKWHILYCETDANGCPVTEFIENRPSKHQVKILRFLSLLEQMGPTLPRPYADLLHDGVHELRITLSGDRIRLLYFFCYHKFIILYHAFHKKQSRVPEKFIRQVMNYRSGLLNRTTREQFEAYVHAGV